jgi:hypothetical protein
MAMLNNQKVIYENHVLSMIKFKYINYIGLIQLIMSNLIIYR